MKLLQYNVLEGCRTEERYTQLCQFLKTNNYDVIGFNELNDWTEDEFSMEMEKVGYPYTSLLEMESSPFHIGIAAKYPIENIYSTEDDPFHHGMLHVKIEDTHFIITHLTPFESEIRERETEKLGQYVAKIDEPLVVMGDLNSLSPRDRMYYEQENAIEKIMGNKFLIRQHIRENRINYQPIQNLLEAGLYDTNTAQTIDYSMPTKINPNYEQAAHVRIDYVLVNKHIKEHNPTSKIIRNDQLAMISDHYPIQCQWDMNNTTREEEYDEE